MRQNNLRRFSLASLSSFLRRLRYLALEAPVKRVLDHERRLRVLEEHIEELEDGQLIRAYEARRAAGTARVRDFSEFEAELDAEEEGYEPA